MSEKVPLAPATAPGHAKMYRLIVGAFIVIVCMLQATWWRPHTPDLATIISKITRKDPYIVAATESPPSNTPLKGPTLDPKHKHIHSGKAVVASDVPECSTIGKNILLKGGNAADAAVSVALCIGSINSYSSGIGGGAFILSRHGEDAISIDARETAPELAYKDMYRYKPNLSVIGGLAVATPGELKGLDELHKRHGSGNLTWKQLFEPVIDLNRRGFVCTQLFRKVVEIEDKVLREIPEFKRNFEFIYKENDKLVTEGDIIRRPQYAHTLELIANNGSSDIFYDPEGPIAPSLARASQRSFGILSVKDFANYSVKVQEPVVLPIEIKGRQYELVTSRGESSGIALAAGLNFFNELYSEHDPVVLEVHKLVESLKWLASVRSSLGDLRTAAEKNDLIEKYTGKEWIQQVLDEGRYSDNQTFGWRNYQPHFEINEPKGTAHFSVIDENGDSVSMTTTINLSFGSLVLDPGTGIILNNEMDDFSQPGRNNSFGLSPSEYNFIAPRNRPLSSTTPSFIIDLKTNKTDFLIGAAGGSRIPTAVLQAIYRAYYTDYSVLDIMAFPRIHHQLIPETLMVEDLDVFDAEFGNAGVKDITKILEHEFGHTLTQSGALSAMNGIRRDSDTSRYFGVSDYWRKRGEADAY